MTAAPLPAPGAPVLELNNVWAGYDQDTVLEDVTFRMDARDYVGLIGPNGGGKTTLIKVILGLLPPTRGTVRVFDQSPAQGRRWLGYVPQLHLADKDFPIRVWDVAAMGRLNQPGRGGLFSRYHLNDHDRDLIAQSLRQVDMADLSHRVMGELSGGQRQRVYIARALATQPRALLLDEPTASVDPQGSTQLYELLAQLNQDLAILLISHDMTAISTYVKTIGCINRRLVYHHEKVITADMLSVGYEHATELITHGLAHRVLTALDEDHHHD